LFVFLYHLPNFLDTPHTYNYTLFIRYSFRVLNFVWPSGGPDFAVITRTTSEADQACSKLSWLLALYDKYFNIIKILISWVGVAQSV
jgi:hypothetical protein